MNLFGSVDVCESRSPNSRGYTIVELMVVVLIVAILATTLGVLFVKLLTLQEDEREQGYIREHLAAICGAYADFMSVGSNLYTSNQNFAVKYRQETGGVSLETGCVTRAVYLKASNKTDDDRQHSFLDLKVLGGDLGKRFARSILGDAALIPFKGDINIVSKITPIGTFDYPLNVVQNTDTNLLGFVTTDAALGYLQVMAEYVVKDHGTNATRSVTAERIVRLWNRE